ncbi:MAG TPA: hypothetical protein VNX25_08095 [Verrucomicrobiae bacterium]|nr:hypothetical protein [Verrucomicrobiae bacterium]
MDLSHEEQQLLGHFRSLGHDQRKELLDYAHFLADRREAPRGTAPSDRCDLPHREERPEAAKEPLVTE